MMELFKEFFLEYFVRMNVICIFFSFIVELFGKVCLYVIKCFLNFLILNMSIMVVNKIFFVLVDVLE